MHALYSPLSDFGSYPRDCAGAKADRRRKTSVPDQCIEACLRETRDRFDFGQTQECHIIQVGLHDMRYVTSEEQLAIFLYLAVMGLAQCHMEERFQRSPDTLSK